MQFILLFRMLWRYLSLTQQGKQIIANLYSNVFVVEHEKREEELHRLEEQITETI